MDAAPVGCPRCGLALLAAPPPPGHAVRCPRCGDALPDARRGAARNRWAAACALSALLLYLPAVALPVLSVERLGYSVESSVWSGSLALLAEGSWLAGLAVLVCSVVLPLLKLAGLLALSLWPDVLARRDRARTWHAVEFVGRFGMLDVLLVALLVATLKLGDLVTVTPGPGVLAFTSLVALSLAASACFDPHTLWAGTEAPA